jgi:hypothetical protein
MATEEQEVDKHGTAVSESVDVNSTASVNSAEAKKAAKYKARCDAMVVLISEFVVWGNGWMGVFYASRNHATLSLVPPKELL